MAEQSNHPPHAHSHDHGQFAFDQRGRLYLVLVVTFTIFLLEVLGAWWSGSLALMADAGHMLVDASGLLVAAIAARLMLRPATDTHTWGYLRMEVIGAALQAGMLFMVCLMVTVNGVKRLWEVTPVASGPMLLIGAIGLAGNVISLLILLGGRRANLNMRAAFLEVATDTLGSVMVLVAAGLTWATGWQRADAVASLVIAAMMAPRALVLLRESVGVLLEQTPRDLDLAEVRRHILHVEGVLEVHDLHASTIATGLVVLSAHVTVTDDCLNAQRSTEILRRLQHCVANHFPVSVEHSTFQIEPQSHRDCEQISHRP